jgi:DNA-binding transcriptional MocR family regulator
MIESLVLLDVGGRLASYLLRLAREAGAPQEGGWLAFTRPTHQVIANTIGASRETVTRLLRQFAERELIRMRGSAVWIRDEPSRATPTGIRRMLEARPETPHRSAAPSPGKEASRKPAASSRPGDKGEGSRGR